MHIESTKVKVEIGEETFTEPYEKQVLDTTADLLAEIEKDGPQAVKFYNQAWDTENRNAIRAKVLKRQEREVTIEKAIKNLQDMRENIKKPVTYQQARKMIEAQMALDPDSLA
jgi:CRISPR/Cas system CMR-associated protein Cmr1 (group 7 of RAMP superfamily)